jgi:hypothetical protein
MFFEAVNSLLLPSIFKMAFIFSFPATHLLKKKYQIIIQIYTLINIPAKISFI